MRLTRFIARFLLLVFFSLMILMFASCRTKKTTVDKKLEKVSELKQNDIKTSESSRIETVTFKISSSQNFSVESLDPEKPSKIVKHEDGFSFQNAKINFSETDTSEDTATIATEGKSSQDGTRQESNSEASEVKKDKKVKSASWGLNLGIIFGIIAALILLYFYIKS